MDAGSSAAADRVFSEVLSDFAFLFGDPARPEDLPRLEGMGYLARLLFRGRVSGSIGLAVPEALSLEIAANTLGLEPSDPEVLRKAEDAVKEVVSVLGGHLATTVAGAEADVTCTPPELHSLNGADWQRLQSDPATRSFLVNGLPVLLRVEMTLGGTST